MYICCEIDYDEPSYKKFLETLYKYDFEETTDNYWNRYWSINKDFIEENDYPILFNYSVRENIGDVINNNLRGQYVFPYHLIKKYNAKFDCPLGSGGPPYWTIQTSGVQEKDLEILKKNAYPQHDESYLRGPLPCNNFWRF